MIVRIYKISPAGRYDNVSLKHYTSVFDLRHSALKHQYRRRKSEVRGFLDGRIDLLPHQLSIASEVTGRIVPLVLLADEVGMGKTIEACLISIGDCFFCIKSKAGNKARIQLGGMVATEQKWITAGKGSTVNREFKRPRERSLLRGRNRFGGIFRLGWIHGLGLIQKTRKNTVGEAVSDEFANGLPLTDLGIAGGTGYASHRGHSLGGVILE